MFEIGFSEMMLVCVIALLVLGPEKLPGAVRQVFSFIRKIRTLAHNASEQIQKEIPINNLHRDIHSNLSDLKNELKSDKNEP